MKPGRIIVEHHMHAGNWFRTYSFDYYYYLVYERSKFHQKHISLVTDISSFQLPLRVKPALNHRKFV